MSIHLQHFRELEAYRLAMDAAMEFFETCDCIPGKLVMMIAHSDPWPMRSVYEKESGYD